MADQGRLLVTGRAMDRQGRPEQGRVAFAERVRAAADLRQDRHRDIEEGRKIRPPGAGGEVHQRGAAGIGGVGDVACAAGQLPDQPGLDGADLDLALRRPRPRTRHGVQQPGEFRGREIGVEDQASRRLHHRLMPGRGQGARDVRRTPVLPDDGPVQGLAVGGVPQHRGLTLVGDADGGEPPDPARLFDHRPAGLQRRGPDFGGVMLDPARMREMLFQLDLADRGGPQSALGRSLKGDGPGRGCALVDSEDEALHPGRLERRSPDSTGHRGEAAADEPGWRAGGFITKDTKGARRTRRQQ